MLAREYRFEDELEARMEEGLERGLERGLEEGLERGLEIGLIQAAKKFLQKGMAIEEIITTLELSDRHAKELESAVL